MPTAVHFTTFFNSLLEISRFVIAIAAVIFKTEIFGLSQFIYIPTRLFDPNINYFATLVHDIKFQIEISSRYLLCHFPIWSFHSSVYKSQTVFLYPI